MFGFVTFLLYVFLYFSAENKCSILIRRLFSENKLNRLTPKFVRNVLFNHQKFHCRELVIKQTKKMANFECLVFEKDRLQTFQKNWKDLGFKICTPKNFAAAGFYNCHTDSYNDTVKCFSCQKELSDWEEEDDPWQEHIKRGSKCPFVLYKSKTKPTIQDFLELQYETKKIILSNYFETEKQNLHDKEKMLLKKINDLQKSKK